MKRAWRIARRLLGVLLVGAVLLAGALVILIHAIPLPDRTARGTSVIVEYRDGEIAHVFLSPDDKWRLPVDVRAVDPAFVEALIRLEDQRFRSHMGVDVMALGRAFLANARHGRRVEGGSTLSMQLARLLEPRPRTLRSKVIEMFRALQLDARLSKDEILSAYLQLAPYGDNLEGVESASMAYFGHRASHLTPAEIATLLAIPQGPARFAPRPANHERLTARRDQILLKLYFPAAAEPVPDLLVPFPREAPHAARWLRAQHPGEAVIRSTLDRGTQRLAEATLRLSAASLERRGIHNGAVVVIDHRTREAVALVGNLDDGDERHGGQIAMFARPRSPGSTLKPFLYALSVDRGLALPGHLVADVPAAYGSYRPRNFDEQWNGLVTLEDALSRSLNIPFIDLLARFGVEPFLGELVGMGVTSPRADAGHYGLSLIVGGIELTPIELAGLYATLAEGGRSASLRFVRGDVADEHAAFGAGAAYLTRLALSKRDRPDFPARRALRGVPPDIHWKTGTSYGLRDAWAVGSGPTHTAVVWLGNVDNRGSSELVGTEAAGPILFDLLEALAPRQAGPPVAPPVDLVPVEVCAYSGHVPGPACPRRAVALAPLHAVATTPCPYHVAHDVDVATGEAVTPMCRAGRTLERKSFVALPSRIARWLEDHHRQVPEQPVFAAGCAPDDGRLAMLTPSEGQVVVLLPGLPPASQEIPLQAEAAGPVSWFVDGELVATAPAREKVYWIPTTGRHEVVVRDDAGRRDRRTLEVKLGRR